MAVDRVVASGEEVVTTRPSLAELYVGMNLADSPEQEATVIAALLQEFPVLEFDDAAAHAYGWLQAHLRRRGTPIGAMDVLIAAIAMTNGHSLVTANARHFVGLPGLAVVEY